MNPTGILVLIFGALVVAQVTIGGALERLGIIPPTQSGG
jgi:hypothetical protein